MSDINKNNKYRTNNKINLYKDNLIKFIIEQKSKIIMIGIIDDIDYIVGILFLTETNRYCKLNKISIHGYYLAYTFINLFNKLKKKLYENAEFNIDDINHYVLSLSNNIDYLNSRIDPTNPIKNKINNNLSKLLIDMIPILNNIFLFNKVHKLSNGDNEDTIPNGTNTNTSSNNLNNKYCDDCCYNCVTFILSKFFYVLLQTAKFLGSGTYNEPNLIRLSEYYANIFYVWFKSKEIHQNKLNYTGIYDNYLNYKNKLNYSLIELNLNSETLDEIIKYLDDEITENLSIKIK